MAHLAGVEDKAAAERLRQFALEMYQNSDKDDEVFEMAPKEDAANVRTAGLS